MNNRVIISLLVVFASPCGDAFFLNKSKASQELSACYDAHSVGDGNYANCYENNALEACLKKIVSESDADRDMLKGAFHYMEMDRKTCPGFANMKTCGAKETRKCNSNFNFQKIQLDKTICKDTQKVRDCLENALNGSCTPEFINSKIWPVDLVAQQCKDGTLFEDPCGRKAIHQCNKVLYGDFILNDKGVRKYACRDEEIAKAKKCHSDLENNCKGELDTWTLDWEKSNLGLVCPKSMKH